jgi:exopolysaccharide biosynthesis protein
VVACSCALAAFTTFVLLDAFVLERVGQTVQEADLSSIVEAQGNVSTSASDDEADGATSDTAEAVDATSDGTDAASESADTTTSHSHSGRHGGHGGPGGKRSSSDEASQTDDANQTDTTSSADGSVLEEGAGPASVSGTTVGTYSDENMSITVSQVRAYDTDIYVADIQVSSAEYLKTALADNAYGRNLKDTTSNMAEAAGAVLAINGDYYGFRDDGYVVRNGVLYRDTAAAGTDVLVVYGDGSMASVNQDEKTAQQLVDDGAWQVLSFGPTLVEGGELAVDADDEVGQSRNSNPRTAIGMVSPLHYIVVVSDGRTGDNAGLSLYQLAQVLRDNGATYAYNLDGGGSTTLYFKGEVLNNPTSGNVGGEREVSDIVYFG